MRPSFALVAGDRWWTRLLSGVAATIVGASLLLWNDTTIRVIGLLFGLSLLVSGVTRTVVGVLDGALPAVYRLYTIARGAVGLALAVACLRHPGGSAVFLAVLVGLGLIADGVAEFGAALAAEDRWIHPSGFVVAAVSVIAGLATLHWLVFRPSTFALFSGVGLLALGGTQMIAALRAPASRQ